MKHLAFLGADIWVWMWPYFRPLVKCLRCKSFKLQSQAAPASMSTVLRLKPSVLPLPFQNRAKIQQTKVSLSILFRELVLVFQKLPCLSCYHSVLQEPPEAFAGFLLGRCVAGLYCLTSLLLFSFLWQPPAYFLAPQLGWGPLSNLTRDTYFPATSTFVWCQYLPLSSLS